MQQVNIPPHLPDCRIIKKLAEKANNKTDYEFNYVYYLDELRKRVSLEVLRINVLFPNYTPHDENYHLKRLFYVADLLLGTELIDNMNVTELFLLSISLYGHDWGMAVSEDEKEFILQGCIETTSKEENFNILDDEKRKFSDFCQIRKIETNNISDEDWQEYVRLTHAFRSGKRIKKFFNSISSGIGEFGSRICEGHWLDFENLDDYIAYPIQAPVHLDIVNVKAITIYVRLIDLLDLGEDRTPYLLWKFVAPRNEISALEWNKHRALLPVSFPQYQQGRYIKVIGSTDDENVYASIMDLKNYINEQFRQCSDSLNRINHTYHKLDISHLDWEISSKGFEPVLIKFEFDRTRMFEILSDQIYQGNPYVFVRELIQNSIDAINMREEVYEKKGMYFLPLIEVKINEAEEFYIIEIIDNGIGMDQYIIKNYLAVAGKSYYRSHDFHKQGLKMDAISRFGIGMLSCFMVSESVQIKTFRDPHIGSQQEHLKITIPAKENYFRIEKNVENFSIGTSFSVKINKNALPYNKNQEGPEQLNIYEYLKRTACFVKYPIKIIENSSIKFITKPNSKYTQASENYTLKYNFPFDIAIMPQDISVAKELFYEKKYELKEDLELEGYEGCIIFLLPLKDSIDALNIERSWPSSNIQVIDFKNKSMNTKLEWHQQWTMSSSSKTYEFLPPNNVPYNIYMDGLLLSDLTPPEIKLGDDLISNEYNDFSMMDSFISPYLVANIPKSNKLKIDLARTKIISDDRWDFPIWKAFINHIKKTEIPIINKKSPKDKLLSLSKLATFYGIPPYIILNELITPKEFPIVKIVNGKIIYEEFISDLPKYLKIIPRDFKDEIPVVLEEDYLEDKNYTGTLKHLVSKESVLINTSRYFYNENEKAMSILNILHLSRYFLRINYTFDKIEFITSPIGSHAPIVQEIYALKVANDYVGKDKNINLLKLLEEKKYHQITTILKKRFYSFPTLVDFPKPFNTYLGYSFKYLNVNNELVIHLIRAIIIIINSTQDQNFSKEISGKLYDEVKSLPFLDRDEDNSLKDLNYRISSLFEKLKDHQMLSHDFNTNCSVTIEDFVPHSINMNEKGLVIEDYYDRFKYLNTKKKWGKIIA